jgi:hypothetical protein
VARIKASQVTGGLFGGPKRTKGNKYHAMPTVHNGIRYDSKAEAERAAALDAMQDRGEVLMWVGHPKFRLGCPENVYVSDFLVITQDGFHVEDTKGFDTEKFRHNKRLWASYGRCPLWIIRRGKVVEIVEPGASPDA